MNKLSEQRNSNNRPPRKSKRGGLSIVDNSQQINECNKKFGILVRNRREELGISQKVLSEMANVDRSYLSNIELGKRRVSLDIAIRLSKLLSLSIDGIFREKEKTTNNKQNNS